MAKNLLEEIFTKLSYRGKTERNIRYVILNGEEFCTWQEFKELAKDIKYNNGTNTTKLKTSLKIIGNTFWLERWDYDGAEWWEYREKPKKPLNHKIPTKEDLLFINTVKKVN